MTDRGVVIFGVALFAWAVAIVSLLYALSARRAIALLRGNSEFQKAFSQDTAHEMSAPLAALQARIELLKAAAAGTPEYEAHLHSALSSLTRITGLVDDLRMVSILDEAFLKDNLAFVRLDVVVRQAVEEMLPLVHARGMEVDAGALCAATVMGNAEGIRRTVVNLLGNAVRYGGTGGAITVGLSQERTHVGLTVHNDGEAIPDEQLDYLFNRFYRVNQSDNGRATGLGLAIVKAVVDSHEGTVSVQSAPGQGTTFVVRFRKISGPNLPKAICDRALRSIQHRL